MTTRATSAQLAAIAALTLAWAGPRSARANSADAFGLGSEAIARGGAMAAAADDYQALFYNPAGLAGVERATLMVGYMRFMSDLSWRGQGPGVDDRGSPGIKQPDTLTFALTVPMGRLTVGAYVGTLPTSFLYLDMHEPTQPTFGFYTNRTQRMLVLLGAGLDLGRGVSFGASVNVFAGLNGPAIANVGPTGAVEPAVFLGADTLARVNLGLRWEVDDALRLGLTYRQAFSMPVKVAAQSTVGDVPLTIDFTGHAMQTPHELVAGAAYRIGVADLSADFTYQRWSSMPSPWLAIDANVTGIAISSPPVQNPYRDAYGVRLGADVTQELRGEYALHYRGGLRFATTMGVQQTSNTNMLDGNKLGGAAGIGLHYGDLRGLPLDVDAHFAMTEMFDRTHTKAAGSGSPYTTITGGGRVYSVGLTVRLGLTR